MSKKTYKDKNSLSDYIYTIQHKFCNVLYFLLDIWCPFIGFDEWFVPNQNSNKQIGIQ